MTTDRRARIVAAIKSSPFEELRTVDHAQNGPLQITVRVDDLADTLLRALAAAESDDTGLAEADIDRMMAAGVPVQIVTAPPQTHAAGHFTVTQAQNFHEPDEDPAAVQAAFEAGEKGATTPAAGDRPAEEAYRLAVSTALGLGTGANWEAIRDRAEDLTAEVEGLTQARRRFLAQQQPGPGQRCTCGGTFPLHHLHADTHAPAVEAQQQTETPCGPAPDMCDPETGEPCDVHEVEQAHTEGDHEHCGITCEIQFPSEQMRNFVVAKGYPGTAGMLDELLRRAAVVPAGTGEEPAHEALCCVCGDPVEWMDVDVAYGSGWIHSPGSDTPCLNARPRCPDCQMPHVITPGMQLACASILASIRDRDAATDPQPVQHAPGIAIRCADCRAKGHTACMDDADRPSVPCSRSVLRLPHTPHKWQPQPGMDWIDCPGSSGWEMPDDDHHCADSDCTGEQGPAVPQPGKEH